MPGFCQANSGMGSVLQVDSRLEDLLVRSTQSLLPILAASSEKKFREVVFLLSQDFLEIFAIQAESPLPE
jgi:hypothetical protein